MTGHDPLPIEAVGPGRGAVQRQAELVVAGVRTDDQVGRGGRVEGQPAARCTVDQAGDLPGPEGGAAGEGGGTVVVQPDLGEGWPSAVPARRLSPPVVGVAAGMEGPVQRSQHILEHRRGCPAGRFAVGNGESVLSRKVEPLPPAAPRSSSWPCHHCPAPVPRQQPSTTRTLGAQTSRPVPSLRRPASAGRRRVGLGPQPPVALGKPADGLGEVRAQTFR